MNDLDSSLSSWNKGDADPAHGPASPATPPTPPSLRSTSPAPTSPAHSLLQFSATSPTSSSTITISALPPTLLNLPNLRYLDLTGNNFFGVIHNSYLLQKIYSYSTFIL
ncbi:hypothetical protein K1719_001758 [Acacia pycnantha]|nr:hypothetical protein K1719_001758 [Acacia pycnantha]